MHARRLVPILLNVVLAGSPALAANGPLAVRTQNGRLVGLRIGTDALPARALGGFYVRRYTTANTGPNVLTNSALATLPRPLPAYFAVDEQVRYRGRPTITISQPGDRNTDSGYLNLEGPVRAGHVYLLGFAHRGSRLGGELPPIIHVRQYDAAGQTVTEQNNVELLAGSYGWKEETLSIPALDRTVRIELSLHHPAGTGQFWISEPTLREVAEAPATPVPGRWAADRQGRPGFQGKIAGTEVKLSAVAVPNRVDGLTMNVTLSAPSAYLGRHPQALLLSFRAPLDAAGWRWGDYVRRDRAIQPGATYANYHLLGLRQLRVASWFPLAAVSGPRHGVAAMAPLTPTTLNRLSYDAGGFLNLEFDLGLAPRTSGGTEKVDLSFDLVPYAPRWGYREALSRFYARYPDHFASAAKHGGWWIGPTAKVKDIGGFGLQYSENHFTHADDAQANNAAGLYTCSYCEPWMWRIETMPPTVKDVADVPPLESFVPQLEKDAELPASVNDIGDYFPAPRRESVRAFFNSVLHGTDGKIKEHAVRSYGATVMEFSTSALPGIRSDRWGDANRGLLSYKYETLADQKRAATVGAKVDGVYFDSVGDWSDISAEDHRAEHFRFSAFPLTFSYATGTPIVSGLSAMAQYMQFIRAKQLITMANSDAKYAGYAAPYLDMVGAGENYYDGDDQTFCQDRAVAHHKSVSFLNSGMTGGDRAEAEKRFRLLLFYDIYPGINVGDAAPVEQARPLYRRYMPLMQQLSAAGWEPVTWATVDDPAVWVERYGTSYFALRNSSAEAKTVTVKVEPGGFGRQAGSALSATELLSGQEVPLRRDSGALVMTLSVAPHDTAIVRLAWR